MFRIIFQGPHGPTAATADPKLEAYKQMAYIKRILGRRYCLTCHADGAYTVVGEGLDPLTFKPEQAT